MAVDRVGVVVGRRELCTSMRHVWLRARYHPSLLTSKREPGSLASVPTAKLYRLMAYWI